ncbi:MAG TPA: L-dopachrome tautomerase-related protein, partial [Myxococcales bacterium]|nr:L-dopachrome tautomerase-related protein [Myxococcales bacterium]
PQDWIIRTPAKEMTFAGGAVALKAGIDGLVLSSDDAWLYYAAMTHDTLYRVRTADLRDPGLDGAALAKRVEKVGRKPLSDGLGIDANGDVLVTDVEHGGVVRVSAGGALTTLLATPKVRWADGVVYGPDGWLYLADSDIPDQMLQSKEHIRAHAPYYIWRLKPDAGGVPGR